ncbi:MAG TPA: MFS transporter [Gaiellaceae bacterium]|jgi:MFS family permease|nr:MFS transporter [Gaiellaceae bacterium]
MSSRFGALAERDFRLVFSSTTVSAVGDGVAYIALAFAVLHISNDSPTAVGVVLACRQAAAAVITLAAGVIADRLPRHVVLVAVASVQAVVQTVVGLLLVGGHATVTLLAVLGALYGLADGFVIPAQNGLIPAVVSSSRLQQANALLGLSRSILGFGAPALGGVLVAAGSPGGAILVDAASFAVAAALLVRVRVEPRADVVEPEPFLRELRDGWSEFRRQRWIFNTIVFFGIGNLAGQAWNVLAPLVVKEHYGGATHFGFVGAAFGIGLVIGGVVTLRWRPSRPLLVSCLCAAPYGLGTWLLAFLVPYPVLLAGQLLAGTGLAIHLALWFTVFQQQVPEHARARVSSYDALGSFVLVPLGTAVVGPLAVLLGVRPTLIAAGAVVQVTNLLVLAQPAVWSIRGEPAPAPA